MVGTSLISPPAWGYVFFPTTPHEDLVNQYKFTHTWCVFSIVSHFVLWYLLLFVCTLWCVLFFVAFGIVVHYRYVFAHAIYSGALVFRLVTHTRRPTGIPTTHFVRVLHWRASLHNEMLVGGGWCWLDDVQRFPVRNWLLLGDPGKQNIMFLSDFVLISVWELHPSAITPPFMLSVASTTNKPHRT